MTDIIAQKEIARALDAAAARAEIIDREPATGKQCWFLAGLLLKAGLTEEYLDCGCTNSNAVLTKRDASREIEAMLNGGAK